MIALMLAHAGHAGDHGWLAGALQPLLSADHLAAGLFVAGVSSVALYALLRRMRRSGAATSDER